MTNDKAVDLFKKGAKEAGISDEAILAFLGRPEFKEIENRDNRHSEYSSALDKAKNLEEKARKSDEWNDWWNNKGGKDLFAKSQQLDRYTERFGALDSDSSDTDKRRAAAASGVTLDQINAILDQREQQLGVRFSAMNTDVLAVIADATTRGIKLTGDDVLAMNKVMAEKGVTYAGAYELHMGPRVREMEEKSRKDQMEAYADQKVKDALSRAGYAGGIPPTSEVPTGFFDRPKDGMTDKPKNDQELMAMWNEAGEAVRNKAA